jgi:hypothetical protein
MNVSQVLDYTPIKFLIFTSLISIVFIDSGKLPLTANKVLSHPATQFVILFAAYFMVSRMYLHALLFSGAVVGVLYGLKMVEFLEGDISASSVTPKNPSVFPGCENLKKVDVLTVFSGDTTKMKQEFRNMGIHIELDDSTAPLISTLLVYSGYTVSGICKAPYFDKVA